MRNVIVMSIVLLCVAGAFAYTGGWLTPGFLTPSRLVDTFERVNGEHPGFRRNHAKGVCAAGYFEGNGQGVPFSKAVVFEPGRVPVIGRFALAGGQPYAADGPAAVRSMAIRFELRNGEEWRTGMNSIPVFPVNSAQGFYDQLEVAGDPARMKAFFAKHPESAQAIAIINARPISSGFENTTFNSLNAFRFENAGGVSVPVRWSMRPEQAFEEAQAGEREKNYLFDKLIASAHSGPVRWHLVVTIGQPEDSTNDATIAWPANRRQLDVGTLTIDRIDSENDSENDGRCRDINFDPLVLPSGISPSDDPLLSARSAAYSQSFTRRAGEKKDPSAVK
jgi:catalase